MEGALRPSSCLRGHCTEQYRTKPRLDRYSTTLAHTLRKFPPDNCALEYINLAIPSTPSKGSLRLVLLLSSNTGTDCVPIPTA